MRVVLAWLLLCTILCAQDDYEDKSVDMSDELYVLTPHWAGGPSEVTQQERESAFSFLLAALLVDAVSEPDICLVRLRGFVTSKQAEEIEKHILEGVKRLDYAQDLLLTSAWSETRETCVRLVLNPQVDVDLRATLAEHLLWSVGRPALEQLYPLLESDGVPDALLFRILAVWRTIGDASDGPILQRFSERCPLTVKPAVLRLWAFLETDPDRRWKAFQAIWDADPHFLESGLRALGTQGSHAGIASRLRVAIERDRRRLSDAALRSFAFFAEDPGELIELYESRVSPQASIQHQAPWMLALSGLPSGRARQYVAEWFFEKGWQTGNIAFAIVRSLASSSAVDPFLETFLLSEEAPMRLRMSLAFARAARSEPACQFLRHTFDTASSVEQARIVTLLAPINGMENVSLLVRVATTASYTEDVRARAIEALLAEPSTWFVLEEGLQFSSGAWQVDSAFVRLAFLTGEQKWVEAANLAVSSGMGYEEELDLRALRLLRWNALAECPWPSYLTDDWVTDFSRQLIEELKVLLLSAEGEVFPEPRSAAIEFAEIQACATAILAAMGERRGSQIKTNLLALPANEIASAPLFAASLSFAKLAPEVSELWCRELLERDLQPSDRLRVFGLLQRVVKGEARAVVLRQLLDSGPDLWSENDRAIRWAFSPEGEGWVLIKDRLLELWMLAHADEMDVAECEAFLAPLLEAYASAEALKEAGGLIWDKAGWSAWSFFQRAYQFSPYDPFLRDLFN